MNNLLGIFCPGLPGENLAALLKMALAGLSVPPGEILTANGLAGWRGVSATPETSVPKDLPNNSPETGNPQCRWLIDGKIDANSASEPITDAQHLATLLRTASGHFAGAIGNDAAGRLWLFRDPCGTRPLYYGWADLALPNGTRRRAAVFASTLKLLRGLPGFTPVIRRAAVAQMISRSCCHDCIWEDFYHLPPGGIIELTSEAVAQGVFPHPAVYWSVAEARAAGKIAPFTGSADEAETAVLTALRKNIRGFFSTAAPRGVLLSGGIDSALVASICAWEKLPVKAFTLRFEDSRYDEAPAAAAIARHLQIAHETVEITEEGLTDFVPKIPAIWDEPFADSSQIPTYFVCRAAGQFAPEILAGDAGDENFGGYERYQTGDYFWRYWRKIPAFIRRAGSEFLQKIPVAWGNRLCGNSRYPRFIGDKLHRLATAAGAATFAEFYPRLTLIPGAEKALRDFPPGGEVPGAEEFFPAADEDFSAQAMSYDWATYLPDDTLVKTDRAARAGNLEILSPFLDPEIIKLAFALPMARKITFSAGRITGKYILRQLLRRFLPAELLLSPKKGFGVPLDVWLRKPLLPWADAVLQSRALDEDDLLDAPAIRRMWQEHRNGCHNFAPLLWNVLMYQEWKNHYARA